MKQQLSRHNQSMVLKWPTPNQCKELQRQPHLTLVGTLLWPNWGVPPWWKRRKAWTRSRSCTFSLTSPILTLFGQRLSGCEMSGLLANDGKPSNGNAPALGLMANMYLLMFLACPTTEVRDLQANDLYINASWQHKLGRCFSAWSLRSAFSLSTRSMTFLRGRQAPPDDGRTKKPLKRGWAKQK